MASSGNPYVGPRSFQRNATEARLFFGREQEARDLLVRVQSERLTLFYAQSGAGKSSLINARLIPGLEERGFVVLPVARVSGDVPPDLRKDVANVFLFNLMDHIQDERSSPHYYAHITLTDFLMRLISHDGIHFKYDPDAQPEAINPEGGVPYVLIIDQFEEILTTNLDHWRERTGFFQQLDSAMRSDPNLWVVLTLREDFVAGIEPYAPLMADRMRSRFYMQRMQGFQALDAIRLPAQECGRPFDPSAAQALVDNLRQERIAGDEVVLGQYVEPVQLQVVCLQLWESLVANDAEDRHSDSRTKNAITLTDLNRLAGGRALADFVDQALMGFYNRSLREVLSDPDVEPLAEVNEASLRRWFSRELITVAGTRGFVLQGETHTAEMPNVVLRLLRNLYLLRAENRAGGIWLELIHDRFIAPIIEDNDTWRSSNQNLLQTQAQLWLDQKRTDGLLLQNDALAEAERWESLHVGELLEHEREFLATSRKARRRRRLERLMLSAITILAIVAAIATVLVRIAQRSEREQRIAAETAEEEAIVAKNVAETAEAEAIAAEDVALTAEAIAVDQRNEALDNESRLLANRALGHLGIDPVASLHLALQGLPSFVQPRPYVPSVELALVQAVRSSLERDFLQVSQRPLTPNRIALNPQEPVVAVGGEALRLVHLDLSEVVTLSTAATDAVQFARVAWNDDGSRLLRLEPTDDEHPNRILRIWRHHEEVDSQLFEAPISCAEWEPVGESVAVCSGQGLWLWFGVGATRALVDDFPQRVIGARWSSDGRWLAGWDDTNTVIIWDNDLESVVFDQTPDTDIRISGLEWVRSSSGTIHLAIAWADGNIRLFSPESTLETTVIPTDSAPGGMQQGTTTGLKKIGESHFVTWGMSDINRIWVAEREIANFGQALGKAQGIAIAPSGAEALTFHLNGSAELWDLSTINTFTQTRQISESTKFAGHSGVILSASWHPHEPYIATTGIDGSVRTWDRATGASLAILRGHTSVDSLLGRIDVPGAHWITDHYLTTYGEDGTFRKWKVFDEHGEPIVCHEQPIKDAASCLGFTQGFWGHRRDILSMRWKGSEIVVTTDRDGNAGRFDLATGQSKILDSDDWEVPVSVWNQGGTHLLTYEEPDDEPEEFKTEIREFDSGTAIQTIEPSVAEAIWFDDVLVVGYHPAGIGLYNSKTFDLERELAGSQGTLTAAALSEGDLLVGGFSEGGVYLWDLNAPSSLDPIAQFLPTSEVMESPIKSFQWSEGSATTKPIELLIVGDSTVIIWEVGNQTHRLLYESDSLTTAALSPDGRWLAIADHSTVHVIDAETGESVWTLDQHTDRVQGISWIWGKEWSHQPAKTEGDGLTADDSRQRLLLLTWSGDKSTRLWDWKRRQQIDLLYGNAGINIAAVSPDSQQIVTAADNGTLRVWDSWIRRPEELYATGCSLLTRPLSVAQLDEFSLQPSAWQEKCPN